MTADVVPFPSRLVRSDASKIAADWGLQWPLDDALAAIAASRTRAVSGTAGLAQAERDIREALGLVVTAIDREVALRRDAAPPATITAEHACDWLRLPWRLREAVEHLKVAAEADSRASARAALEAGRMMLEAELAQCLPGPRRRMEIED